MDPDLDLTLFFIDFKDANKFFLSYFCLISTSSSVLKCIFLLKFCLKILFCKHYFSLHDIFMKKVKDPEPDLDPYL